MVEKARFVIIGGGVAGAAVAHALARRGERGIVLLEREILPGMHSSGRNAAMMRQNVPEETNCRLAVESMRFFNRPPADFPLPLDFRPTGSMILASGSHVAELRAASAMQRRVGLEVQELSPKEAARIVPLLEETNFEAAFFCPSDGTIDIHALLQGYLRDAERRGASIRLGTEVEALLVRGGRATGVRTALGEIEAEWVVNAAGAWAASLPGLPGPRLPIRPCRRHLVVTLPFPGVDRRWPFAWDISHGFYFRPETGGLLMSPCDEEEMPPGDAPVDPRRVEETAEKAMRLVPRAGSARPIRAWAGLRNLTPDHLFLVGSDETLPGFFWAAGLGGHGMTASPALGEIAADLLLEGRTERIDAARLAPDRFRRESLARSGAARKALLG